MVQEDVSAEAPAAEQGGSDGLGGWGIETSLW